MKQIPIKNNPTHGGTFFSSVADFWSAALLKRDSSTEFSLELFNHSSGYLFLEQV